MSMQYFANKSASCDNKHYTLYSTDVPLSALPIFHYDAGPKFTDDLMTIL